MKGILFIFIYIKKRKIKKGGGGGKFHFFGFIFTKKNKQLSIFDKLISDLLVEEQFRLMQQDHHID